MSPIAYRCVMIAIGCLLVIVSCWMTWVSLWASAGIDAFVSSLSPLVPSGVDPRTWRLIHPGIPHHNPMFVRDQTYAYFGSRVERMWLWWIAIALVGVVILIVSVLPPTPSTTPKVSEEKKPTEHGQGPVGL